MSFSAKSIVFDIANNYGDSSFVGIRAIEFFLSSVLETGSYTADATTENFNPVYAFDTTKSKTGNSYAAGWESGSKKKTNQRVICVFNSAIDFDSIVVNNFHSGGGYTNRGAQDVKITISPDSITNTTYNATVSNGTVIFNNSFSKHVGSDIADDEVLLLITPGGTELKDVSFDINAAQFTNEGVSASISAYYQYISDTPLSVDTLGEKALDTEIDVSIAIQDFTTLPLIVHAASKQVKDIPLSIWLTDGGIQQDTPMDIAVGDGNNITNIGMDIMTTRAAPDFKMRYAINLDSVIKEI